MMLLGRRYRWNWVAGAVVLSAGCTTVTVPSGFTPGSRGAADTLLPAGLTTSVTQTPLPPRGNSFELPPNLPGSEKLTGTPLPDKSQFPTLPVLPSPIVNTGEALSLAKLQEMAYASNPALRKANADADAAYGAMIQAGLHPNPTVGYQADQMQPWLTPRGTTGQQGAYLNQLIKTAGKLGLTQQVAGYDYLNAVVAARKVQLDVMAQVRSNYFSVLVAEQAVSIHRSLISLADEVYELQRRQVKAGEAAAYEPLQLFAQAALARNNMVQAEQNAQAAWRQLAASLGQPALKRQPLTGQADHEPPAFDFVALEQSLAEHTDVLVARNRELQAEANLRLQQVTPIPDVSTNVIVQYDNSLGTSQFGVQLGVSLPLYDRNQGAIRQAQATLAGAADAIQATQNDLTGRLAEARGRFETHRTLANNYRTLVLPNLSQAYRAMIRRYQVEPEAVKFNDIVVAQQNLAQAMQTYLSSLEAQWKAVVDLAALGQVDELYPAKK